MCLHLADFFMVNVGKYTSPMDPMGIAVGDFVSHTFRMLRWMSFPPGPYRENGGL